jgi:hypothetical protein
LFIGVSAGSAHRSRQCPSYRAVQGGTIGFAMRSDFPRRVYEQWSPKNEDPSCDLKTQAQVLFDSDIAREWREWARILSGERR